MTSTTDLTLVDVYHGYDKPDVIIDIPPPLADAGSWHGEIRSRLVDEAGDWWFQCDWRGPDRLGRITTFPVTWCRRPELDDFAGIIPPAHLDRMRAEQAGETDIPHASCPRCTCGSRGPEHCRHAHLPWG